MLLSLTRGASRIGSGGKKAAGAMKWADAQIQEAQGEGTKPLPKVRQVGFLALLPGASLFQFSPEMGADTHQGSEWPVATDINVC